MSDDHNPFSVFGDQPLDPNADKGREPQFVYGRGGTRRYSLAALVERIETAFAEEHADSSPALREATTRPARLALVRDTADYVLAVESIHLDAEDRADLIRRAYSNLFGYGPLDALFADPTVTTILLEGGDRASVRYGHGELVSLGHLFEDGAHMRQMVARLLRDADAELSEDEPIMEFGLTVEGRPICVNMIAPPAAHTTQADIRVHPAAPPALTHCVSGGFIPAHAEQVLAALAASRDGVLIVGDVESGKTTMLSLLAGLLPNAPERVCAVERAGELRLPPGVARFMPRWRVLPRERRSFGDQIFAALQQQPEVLLLDEVRADSPHTIAPLLDLDAAPRLLWTFRGVPDSKRLQSALGMLARRADPGAGERLVHALYDRLPFIVTVARIRERLQMFSVAEWQPNPTSEYPDFVQLMQYLDGEIRPTGRHPVRPLALPDSVWDEA